MKKRVILGLIACFAAYGRAQAYPIIYTLSSTGTGHLGTNLFSGAFTITSTADTSQIVNSSTRIFHVTNIMASIFVSGVGNAEFTIPTIEVSNQNHPGVGFSDPVQNIGILFANNPPEFASYDLGSSLGPLTGHSQFAPGSLFGTSAGNFSLISLSTVATFQAVVVPEPSISALLGFGLVSLASQLIQRRKSVP